MTDEPIYSEIANNFDRRSVVIESHSLSINSSSGLLIAIIVQLADIHNVTISFDMAHSSILKLENRDQDLLVRLFIELEVHASLAARGARKRKSRFSRLKKLFCCT